MSSTFLPSSLRIHSSIQSVDVYTFLKERKDDEHRSYQNEGFQDLYTVQFEVLKYLSKTPAAIQSDEDVTAAIAALEKYSLTKAEMLMILNLRPTTDVELYQIVEELDDRMDADRRQQLLEEVDKILPALPVADGGN
ncbi:hypothetical protein HDU76_000461 [Blyttiomyces sp. JEL0837]|nr:hypothetical protein HDU76_000461 [Blyttiomyces sp. JEL0837]